MPVIFDFFIKYGCYFNWLWRGLWWTFFLLNKLVHMHHQGWCIWRKRDWQNMQHCCTMPQLYLNEYAKKSCWTSDMYRLAGGISFLFCRKLHKPTATFFRFPYVECSILNTRFHRVKPFFVEGGSKTVIRNYITCHLYS